MIYQELKDIPEADLNAVMEKYVLVYDNMCHLDALAASKRDLPLPGKFRLLWKRIQKVIDRLHLRNHKDTRCHEAYNPDKVLSDENNTMAGEQTFAWLSRFKKVVNSMSQTHHLFFLHRMVKRRNKYTATCRRRNVEPVLPGVNPVLGQNK